MKVIGIIVICILILAVLYLLMIMPRVAGKPDTAPFTRWLYAHRGLHDNRSDAPENSLRAFQKAVEAGFGIEMDIQMTKDHVPVVFHDFTLKRICNADGKIADYTFEELQQFHLCDSDQKIPKFEDVLKLVDGKVPLIVELKIEALDTSICPAGDKLLSAYKGMYCIESFNPLGVFWYRRHRKEIVRGQLSDAFLREGEYRGVLYFLLQNLVTYIVLLLTVPLMALLFTRAIRLPVVWMVRRLGLRLTGLLPILTMMVRLWVRLLQLTLTLQYMMVQLAS